MWKIEKTQSPTQILWQEGERQETVQTTGRWFVYRRVWATLGDSKREWWKRESGGESRPTGCVNTGLMVCSVKSLYSMQSTAGFFHLWGVFMAGLRRVYGLSLLLFFLYNSQCFFSSHSRNFPSFITLSQSMAINIKTKTDSHSPSSSWQQCPVLWQTGQN